MNNEELLKQIWSHDLPIIISNTQTISNKIEQAQIEHITILAAMGILLIVGIAILINQRKIKKQLKKLLEEKEKSTPME